MRSVVFFYISSMPSRPVQKPLVSTKLLMTVKLFIFPLVLQFKHCRNMLPKHIAETLPYMLTSNNSPKIFPHYLL